MGVNKVTFMMNLILKTTRTGRIAIQGMNIVCYCKDFLIYIHCHITIQHVKENKVIVSKTAADISVQLFSDILIKPSPFFVTAHSNALKRN